jgi:hypothetical protein
MTETLRSMENVTNYTDTCGSKNTFHWPDYAVLAVLLIVSACIGLFYGCFGPEQKTSRDFLLGGSSMRTFPMAMSLASRFVNVYFELQHIFHIPHTNFQSSSSKATLNLHSMVFYISHTEKHHPTL